MLTHHFQIQEAELKTKAVNDPRAAVAIDVAELRAIPHCLALGLYQASCTTWRPDLSRSSYRQRRFVLRITLDSRLILTGLANFRVVGKPETILKVTN